MNSFFLNTEGPWCCTLFWKSLIQAIPCTCTMPFMCRASLQSCCNACKLLATSPTIHHPRHAQPSLAQLSVLCHYIPSAEEASFRGKKKIKKLKELGLRGKFSSRHLPLDKAMSDNPSSSVSIDSIISELVEP